MCGTVLLSCWETVDSRTQATRLASCHGSMVYGSRNEESDCHFLAFFVLQDRLTDISVPCTTEWVKHVAGSELRNRVEAISGWYRNDWMVLDNKLRSSIVEGISVFLLRFDMRDYRWYRRPLDRLA